MNKTAAVVLAAMVVGCNAQGGRATTLAGERQQDEASTPTAMESAISSLRQREGIPFKNVVLTRAQPTGNYDEFAQPDILGEYDHLMPVPESYPIPERPSRMHDVATMRNGNYLRPHIPTSRTTVDGRIGVGMTSYVGKRLQKDIRRAVSFFLYTPEKLAQSGTHISQASDGSTDMMADTIWWVPESEVIDYEASSLRTQMFAICDSTLAQLDHELYQEGQGGVQRNPYPINSHDEAYDLHLITGNPDDQSLIFSIPIRIIVKDAKTPQAQIARIESLGEPIVAQLPFTPIDMFEPTITGDGRLLVYRLSGTPGQGGGAESLEPKPWVDNDGQTTYSQFDMVYDYNPPGSGFQPCDPRGWTNPRPISYAHHDEPVRERYGFAKFPFRDPEGRVIGPGEESGMTYPWIDSKGANLFFTGIYRLPISDESTYVTNEDFEMMQSLDANLDSVPSTVSNAFQSLGISAGPLRPNLMLPAEHIIPVPGTCADSCTDSSAREHASSTRGVGVAGLWTEGKMVLFDGLLNATDLGFQAFDSSQRLLRLYHGTGGVVRVGNGRTNTDNPSRSTVIDAYWPLNDSMSESHENKFYYFDEWKPASPKDVSWIVSTGRASTEVSFDDYMDPAAVILSNMQPSMSVNPLGPIKWLKPNTGDRLDRPIRLQNAATLASDAIPPFGAVIGDTKNGTRIEPVALGGIEGKGIWLTEHSGVRYTVGDLRKPSTTVPAGSYFGIFIDARSKDDLGERAIITTPSGQALLATSEENLHLILRTGLVSDAHTVVPLPSAAREGSYFHLGLNRTSDQLEVFVNGMLWRQLDVGSSSDLLRIVAGDIELGGDRTRTGQRGWFDNFEVFNRALIDDEEACIRAKGSLVISQGFNQYSNYPAEAHQRIAKAIGTDESAVFSCHRDYQQEGWGFLASVPSRVRVGSRVRKIKPLSFGQPRPDERDNAFCISCHRTPHPSKTMALEAITLKPLPMEFDRRRQPMQPNAAVIGVIPPDWDQYFPESGVDLPGHAFGDPGYFLSVDSLLN